MRAMSGAWRPRPWDGSGAGTGGSSTCAVTSSMTVGMTDSFHPTRTEASARALSCADNPGELPDTARPVMSKPPPASLPAAGGRGCGSTRAGSMRTCTAVVLDTPSPAKAPALALTPAVALAPKRADAPAPNPAEAPAPNPTEAPAPNPTEPPAANPADAPPLKPADALAPAPADAPTPNPADAPAPAEAPAPALNDAAAFSCTPALTATVPPAIIRMFSIPLAAAMARPAF